MTRMTSGAASSAIMGPGGAGLGVGEGVAHAVDVAEGKGVALATVVAIAVGVTLAVAVGVALGVTVAVAVAVGVAVCVGVAVGRLVAVGPGAPVAAAVAAGVPVVSSAAATRAAPPLPLQPASPAGSGSPTPALLLATPAGALTISNTPKTRAAHPRRMGLPMGRCLLPTIITYSRRTALRLVTGIVQEPPTLSRHTAPHASACSLLPCARLCL